MTLRSRNMDIGELTRTAIRVRRCLIQTFYEGGGGHFGGCLSAIDALTALYFRTLRVDPKDPSNPDRDRFVLSKGHAGVALECTLAEAGFFPKEWLKTYGSLDSPIPTHPDMKVTPGVDMSTGSLGHGMAVAAGMALAAKGDGRDFRVFTLIGDGESHEGSIWEAAMAAAHYGLDNLTAITDYNGMSMDGPVCDVMGLEPLAEKWRSFGWATREIDGHDMAQIVAALDDVPFETGRPSMIVAHTVKAKGLPMGEGITKWHWAALGADDYQIAMGQLQQLEEELSHD
ncbi:transketolase [Chloroflexota bacterium]